MPEYNALWKELGVSVPAGVPAELDASNVDAATFAEGERLSGVYCTGCHVRPEPGILPRNAWLVAFSMILPVMGKRGLLSFEIPAKPGETPGFPPTRLANRNDIWLAPYEGYRLPQRELAQIAYYYFAAASDEAAVQTGKKPASQVAAPFRQKYLQAIDAPQLELFTLAFVDEEAKLILVGEAQSHTLRFLSAEGKELQRITLDGVPIHVNKYAGYYYVTIIGRDFSMGDWQHGEIVRIRARRRSAGQRVESVLKNLERPVMSTFADLDGGGRPGLLVAEFGLYSGSLSWYKPAGRDFRQTRIYDGAGVMTVAVSDLNTDGKPDLVAPVSQNEEAVLLFENHGFGKFVTGQVSKKHPAYGLNSLVLADINGDGNEDIVTINGDDPGASRQPRSYHGVRALMNNGAGKFTERDIYPLHGALLGAARDFDRDGDADILVIAYYPDIEQGPPETLVYLENTGAGEFVPHPIENGNAARWMGLGVGDIDGDGDSDFVVVSFEPPTPDLADWDRAFRRTARPGIAVYENLSPKSAP